MPKPNRRQRAQELLKTVTRGPKICCGSSKYLYAEWRDGVIAELKKLIPELRSSGNPRLP